MIQWMLYRFVALCAVILCLISLVLAYGQTHTEDALIIVVNSPVRFQMRDIVILDTVTGVQYTIWRQQNVERVAMSPDNQQLALALLSTGGLTSVNVANLDEVVNRNHLQDGIGNPVWSPDGQWLAHTGRDFRLAGLYLTASNGMNLALLLAINVQGNPVWSSDNRGLVFVTEVENRYLLQYIEIETGAISTLFSSPIHILEIDWSQHLQVLTAHQIITIDVETRTAIVQETLDLESYGIAYNLHWSPHNNALVFTPGRRAQEVVVIRLHNGRRRSYPIAGLWIVSVDWWQPEN
jgi:Tol biopolymer transport system component